VNFTPEDKIYLLIELELRANYYEREISKCLEWQHGAIGNTPFVAVMLENAYTNLATVNALIAKAWELK
jgi:hypothetical protein